jgi:cell division septation protein DedD
MTAAPPTMRESLARPRPVRPRAPAAAPALTSTAPSAPTGAPSPRTTVVEPPAPTRFAIEFGPFLSPAEAERTERQLTEAGHQTVRFRQQTGGGVYAVLIERVPGARESEALVAALREQGFPDAVALVGTDQFVVRVGEPVALRGAVLLAERLRALGHHVRVAAQPGEAVAFVIRHGNFGSRDEADERSAELVRLGMPNHVVRVK